MSLFYVSTASVTYLFAELLFQNYKHVLKNSWKQNLNTNVPRKKKIQK